MAISREEKQQIIDELIAQMRDSQAVILTDYRGITVADLTRLRRGLRDRGASYTVAKDTLARIALKQVGLPVPEDYLKGPTALAFLKQDLSGPTKVLSDFARETKILAIKGGILGQQVVDEAGVRSLMDLPSREVLLGRVLGAVNGPMSNLVGLLNAPLRELVYVLQQRAEQGGTAPAEAPAL